MVLVHGFIWWASTKTPMQKWHKRTNQLIREVLVKMHFLLFFFAGDTFYGYVIKTMPEVVSKYNKQWHFWSVITYMHSQVSFTFKLHPILLILIVQLELCLSSFLESQNFFSLRVEVLKCERLHKRSSFLLRIVRVCHGIDLGVFRLQICLHFPNYEHSLRWKSGFAKESDFILSSNFYHHYVVG